MAESGRQGEFFFEDGMPVATPVPLTERPEIPPESVGAPLPNPASRERRLFLILPIFIGILAGLAVVCFRVSIEWLHLALMGKEQRVHDWRFLVVPTVAGAVIAALVEFVFPAARGSGLNQTKAAMYIHDGYISLKTMFGKLIATALALGAGFSQGPEDPSLQIGAAISSAVSRKFGLSAGNLRLFAPVGAAAGLAAAFNAPITALLFVIEEVVGNWNASVLGSVVLAAIAGDAVSRWFFGDAPMFRVPTLEMRDPRELITYAVLGVTGGGAALLFAWLLRQLRPRLRALPAWTRLVQPPAAGLLIGLIGFLGFPQAMGVGYETMNQAVGGGLGWKLLLALAALKMIAVTLGFVSGTPGGMFAPTLFIGAMLGAAIGGLQQQLLPHIAGSAGYGPIGSYALVGMGVLFAAFLRAPLTSVFLVLEVSGNYSIILPVILANTIGYLLARKFDPVPIFEVFTEQDGLHLPSMEEVREEARLHIEDALALAEAGARAQANAGSKVPVITAGMRYAEALRAVTEGPGDDKAVVVQFADGNCFSLTVRELEALGAEASLDTAVGSLLPVERMPVLYPDLALDTALHHFGHWPALAVRNRARLMAVEGVLTEEVVLKCYREREAE